MALSQNMMSAERIREKGSEVELLIQSAVCKQLPTFQRYEYLCGCGPINARLSRWIHKIYHALNLISELK